MNSNTVTPYTVRFRRKHLRRWTARLPRTIGATLISEAFTELLAGDAGAVKSLEFVSHCDGRKKRSARVAVDRAPGICSNPRQEFPSVHANGAEATLDTTRHGSWAPPLVT